MGIHDGHRDRLKARFLEQGLDGFNELNALELLLFYAIPRRDTNELAHALLDRFETLSGVFDASFEELTEVPGIGAHTAALIRLVPQLVRKSAIDEGKHTRTISNSRDAGQYFVPRFAFEREEVLLLACLDSQKRVSSCTEMGRGVVNEVPASVRRITETALKKRASSVMLAHNHPDSLAIPSREDELLTREIMSALRLLDIPLIDHIIVSGEEYFSFADAGMLRLLK